jgi:crotonobetainyl-CoA:carnitine CoA-transferase CaiB-like acyl-CoA transferase
VDYATARARWKSRRQLDSVVLGLLTNQTTTQLAAHIRSYGVRAEGVLGPVELINDEHLNERSFFATINHPEFGAKRLVGLPWRRAGGGPFPLGPPPLLTNETHVLH